MGKWLSESVADTFALGGLLFIAAAFVLVVWLF
jgi:hypothetical protein